MALRDIVTLPNPILRRKARKVTEFGPELQTLIDDMIETMRAAPGVGLAAPQVGVSQRVIVVEYSEADDEPAEEGAALPESAAPAPRRLFALVNPEITRVSEETVAGTEGCLSIPRMLGNVDRAQAIVVKAQNRRGQPTKIKAEGWLARIFQHEIDHLEGTLFVDRAAEVFRVEEDTEQVAPAD